MAVSCLLVVFALVCQLPLCSGDVDTAWMNRTLSQHFSQPRHHVTNPEYKQQTMMFIRDQFRHMGLETHIHTFPTLLDNVTGVNVIGVLKGRHFNTADDRVVGIGAHYDTMRNTPGVNDNGAAVVVMLQAARQLARHPLRNYTLLFIAFDFEEWEPDSEPQVACGSMLCGSSHLVNTWLPNFWTRPVGWRGVFVMDTILNFDLNTSSQNFPPGVGAVFPSQEQDIRSDGGRGDFLVVAGRGQDQGLLHVFNTSWAQAGAAKFEVESFTLPDQWSMFSDFLRSDHRAFWEADLNAVFLTDTANFRGYMATCYHSPCDGMQGVTAARLHFAAKTCRALTATLHTLAPLVQGTGSTGGVQSASRAASLGPLLTAVTLAICMHRT